METATVQGFIQQVERLMRAGYLFYVQGRLPEHADAAKVDASIAERYETELTRWSKGRRYHGAGRAKVAYLRHQRDFVILATRGKSPFFEREKPRKLDRKALEVFGYRMSWKGGRVKVEIEPAEYKLLRKGLVQVACRLPVEQLEHLFRQLEFLPYAGVKSQYFRLLKEVNRERAGLGLAGLDWKCLPLRFERVPVAHRFSTFV